jgi:hypothetical protein
VAIFSFLIDGPILLPSQRATSPHKKCHLHTLILGPMAADDTPVVATTRTPVVARRRRTHPLAPTCVDEMPVLARRRRTRAMSPSHVRQMGRRPIYRPILFLFLACSSSVPIDPSHPRSASAASVRIRPPPLLPLALSSSIATARKSQRLCFPANLLALNTINPSWR